MLNISQVAPSSYTKAVEDHSGAEYYLEGGHVAMSFNGIYTIPEIQAKLRQVVEADRLHADTQTEMDF